MRVVHLALLLAVLIAEGWMLNDYWNNRALGWESTFAFVGALTSLIFAEPVVSYFYPTPKLDPPQQTIARADVELFNEFHKALPFDPTILTIRDHDFGGSYRTSYLEPLFEFVSAWTDVHKEFVNPQVEAERKKVYAAARKLAVALAGNTTPEGRDGVFSSVFPENLRGGPRPEHVLESARVLNELSRQFIPIYEGFVRLAKRDLLSEPG